MGEGLPNHRDKLVSQIVLDARESLVHIRKLFDSFLRTELKLVQTAHTAEPQQCSLDVEPKTHIISLIEWLKENCMDVAQWIESNRDAFTDQADGIWEFAELGYHEVKSAEFLAKVLQDA